MTNYHTTFHVTVRKRFNQWSVFASFAVFMVWAVSIQTAVAADSSNSIPDWYLNQTAPEGFVVGVGIGDSLPQAKAQARADLAKTLSSQVRTQLNMNTKESNGELQQNSQQTLNETSQAQLHHLKTLQQQQQRNPQGKNYYYVMLGLDIRPLSQRILKTFTALKPNAKPGILQIAPIFQRLTTQLGFIPQLRLYSREQNYYLTEGSTHLPLNPADIVELVPKVHSKNLRFSLQPNLAVYPPEQLFFSQVTSEKAGFLTYIQILEQGQTVLMQANVPIKNNQAWAFPDAKLYDGLITELPTGQNASRIWHLIMRCDQPKSLSGLDAISDQAQQDYQSYQLGQLNQWLQGCDGVIQSQQIRQ